MDQPASAGALTLSPRFSAFLRRSFCAERQPLQDALVLLIGDAGLELRSDVRANDRGFGRRVHLPILRAFRHGRATPTGSRRRFDSHHQGRRDPIMSLAALGFWMGRVLLAALFFMGAQSRTRPIKYGVVPELLPEGQLVIGNALVEWVLSAILPERFWRCPHPHRMGGLVSLMMHCRRRFWRLRKPMGCATRIQ